MELVKEHPVVAAISTALLGAVGVGVSYVMYQKNQAPSGETAKSAYQNGDKCWFQKQADGQKAADCFYAHPTTDMGLCYWNIPMFNYKLGGMMAGTPDLLETQAEAFSGECNMWTPRYRQMGFPAQALMPTSTDAEVKSMNAAREMALGDLKKAFTVFLESRPDKSRPFVIAGHSQGAILMTKVIADCLVATDHDQAKCFVAAYLAGGYVPTDITEIGALGDIHVSAGPEDTSCIMSWDTRISTIFKHGDCQKVISIPGVAKIALYPHLLYHAMFESHYDKKGIAKDEGVDPDCKPRIQVNPLTWSSAPGKGDGYLGAKQYGVSEPVQPGSEEWAESVSVDGHAVMVQDPRSFMKDAGPAASSGNLHPADVTVWFYNIKANVPVRIAAWRKKHSSN